MIHHQTASTVEHRPAPTGPVARLAVSASLCALLLVATYLLFVGNDAGQQLEDAALTDAQLSPRSALPAALSGLRVFSGSTMLLLALVVVFTIGCARRRVRLGLVAAGVIVASVGGATVLKSAVFDRPHLNPASVTLGNSFPSGHVAFAVSAVLALILVSPYRVRPYLVGFGGVWVGAVAATTVTVAWHRLSDVIGSALLALGICCVAVMALAFGRDVSVPPRRRTAPATCLLPAALPASFLLVSWSFTESTMDSSDSAYTAPVAATLAGAAAVAVLFAALLLLRSVDLSPAGRRDEFAA
ncbi:phosphatase PAP2 family protein [Solihabitans fulvus]|uniref:Phosphatase PAP2 family protein n=1 Tax=Solihabitans fulvus TaxID=1892852 RepID=A0A5B2XF74_9PSEU|nr:phosphatase PAP2 family protein [Solihabitans fulvus]KAA2261452.1 phosphatase PAP2 family protein [Solihabitans fulvus]